MENQTENFESFYSERLIPRLDELKPEANDVAKWKFVGICALFLCVACFIISRSGIAIILLIVLIFSIYKFVSNKDIFVADYKYAVVKEIINYLNPGSTYEPFQFVSHTDYDYSGLFPGMYDDISGEDLIRGVYKGVTYQCSELLTQKNGNSRRQNTIQIFNGLFFVAPIRNRHSATYIWPTDDVQLPVSIADYHFQRFIPMPDIHLVEMHHPEFENEFAVYSTNNEGAKALIDETMMKRILQFKNQVGREMRLSFVNGFCFVAISMDENLFEPSLSDIRNKEKIQEYFFSFLLVLSIINQLNLKSVA